MSWWVMCMKPCSPMCTELLHAVAINPPNLLQPSLHCKNDYPFANIELGWPLSRQQYRITGYSQQKAAHCRGAGRIFVHNFLDGITSEMAGLW